MAKNPEHRETSHPPVAPEHAVSTYDTARLEALFASIGEGVIATDENGMITRINQKALRMLGLRRGEVMHQRFLSVIRSFHENGKALDVFERPIVKAFQAGKTINQRSLYLHADGSLVPVHITVSPIIFHKHPIGAIEVFRDLTDEIESDKLKSDFISIASHQLRTPLSAINMYTRMLQDGLAGDLTSEQQPYLNIILTSVERMNALIDTLLNITRIEAGGITVQSRPVQLDSLTRDILTEFAPAAKSKDIKLITSMPSTMQPLHTDNLLIKEICANLLSNAIKYTDAGGTVRFTMTDSPQEVRWEIADTGYGIPVKDQRNIFLKFFRAQNITTKDVSGTGLGLYLIKNLAEALGGELSFESKENVGSTFYFVLPKNQPEQQQPESEARAG
jgi:PAS domain S-box-containing protein